MWKNKTIFYSIVFLILLFLSSCNIKKEDTVSGTTNFQEYVCSSNNNIQQCASLSSGLGTRCYIDSTKIKYITCSSGWSIYSEPVIEKESGEYFCYKDGTCRIEGLLSNPLVKESDI